MAAAENRVQTGGAMSEANESSAEDAYKNSIVLVEDAIAREERSALATVDIENGFSRIESDMDGWDLLVGMVSSFASVSISTSEDLGSWLAEVHDAASEQSGNYDFLQVVLGRLLHHKGDYMDVFSTRDGDDPWRVFHRLFYGHDPLSFGAEVNDNPFYLMFDQRGLYGIVQVVRHLIADTCSKQGLPLPGSSRFDYTNDKGRPWNYMIDLVQELSKEGYGNKLSAESIYEHLLTIRAQDIAGGMAATAITSAYFQLRGITDEIRIAQVRALAYTMSFFSQAIAGAIRQNGIPYINYPLGLAMAKESVALLVASNRDTNRVVKEADRLIERADKVMADYERISALIPHDDIDWLLGGMDGE